MIVTTKSGAVYMIDTKEPAVMRQGSYSPGIDYKRVPDCMWTPLDAVPDVTVGLSMYMFHKDGTMRITTPVVSIDE